MSALDILLRITFFRDQNANVKAEETLSLRDALARLTTTTAPTKAALPWLKLASFGEVRTPRGSLRHNDNVLEITGIEADYDGEQIMPEAAQSAMNDAGVAAVIYTTPSHTPEKPRWRVLCPTSSPLLPDKRAWLVARLNGVFGGVLAAESYTLSQAYYFGALEENAHHHVVLTVEGRAIDLADDLDEVAVKAPRHNTATAKPLSIRPWTNKTAAAGRPWAARQASSDDGWTAYGRGAVESACAAIRSAPKGAKHNTLNSEAYKIGGLVPGGYVPDGEAFSALSDALADIRDHCDDFRKAEATLKTGFSEGKGKPRDVPELYSTPSASDLDNIAPFVAKFADINTAIQRAAQEAAKAQMNKKAEIPPGVYDVDGLLKEMLDDCLARSYRPQPFLSLAAAISAVATAGGRRYCTTTGLRSNLYVISVAQSGAGKDFPLDYVRRALSAADMVNWLGGEEIASGSGLITAMAGHPVRIFCLDEMGLMLQAITGKKAVPYKAEIMALLMKFFSRANSIFYGKQYASVKDNPRIDIQNPHVAVFGATTPSTLWTALEGGALVDGSIARFMVFTADQTAVPRNKSMTSGDFPVSVLEGLQAISRGAEGYDYGGNLSDAMLSTAPMEPFQVPYSPAGEAAMEAYLDKQEVWLAKINANAGDAGRPGEAEIVSRIGEHCGKISMVAAISRNPGAPLIEAHDVQWAALLTDHCARTLLSQSSIYVADNEYEKKLRKGYDLIARFGPITERDLIRRGFKFPDRERQEILNTLIAGGIIDAVKSTPGPDGGRATVRYSAPSFAADDPAQVDS